MRLFPYEIQEISVQNVNWNLDMLNVQSFWTKTKGNGKVVAIVDTGIDHNHPEFTGRIIGAKNFTATNDKDTDGHGTHVAGTIAGKTMGIAPECRIMPLKVFGDAKVTQNIHDAFRYILDWNKTAKEDDKVVAVNCSFGGGYDGFMHYLIRRLINSGVAVIVAAGNAGDGRPDTIEYASYPSFLYEVITTGAVEQSGQPAKYTNTHDGIDIAAPGTNIYSSWPGGIFKTLNGTSMATPHVTGLYTLIVSSFRQREGRLPTVAEAEDILFNHIQETDINPAFVGRGIADATFDTTRWPLNKVQIGAYYNRSGAEEVRDLAKSKGFDRAFIIKY